MRSRTRSQSSAPRGVGRRTDERCEPRSDLSGSGRRHGIVVAMTKLAVVGAGAWGSALGSVLAAGTDVRLWAREPEVAGAINGRHENPLFLPDVALHPALTATTEIEAALADAEVILMAVPAQHFRSVLMGARPFIG